MGYGSEHEREEVTKFHSKYHTVLSLTISVL